MEKQKKFLTVYVVFDDKTQEKLYKLREEIQNELGKKLQIQNIPFHLSLGSFPLDKELELKNKIEEISERFNEFNIELTEVSSFGNKVIFIEPVITEELKELRNNFNCDYANGFDWHPHATLFQGIEEDDFNKVISLAKSYFIPTNSKIVGIQMGEFFPAKILVKKSLCKVISKNK